MLGYVGKQTQVTKPASPTTTPIPTHHSGWRTCHVRGWTYGTHTMSIRRWVGGWGKALFWGKAWQGMAPWTPHHGSKSPLPPQPFPSRWVTSIIPFKACEQVLLVGDSTTYSGGLGRQSTTTTSKSTKGRSFAKFVKAEALNAFSGGCGVHCLIIRLQMGSFL